MDETHSYEVGDILVSLWGHESIHVDFYEVIKVTDKTIFTVELGHKIECRGQDSRSVMPDRSKRGTRVHRTRIVDDGGFLPAPLQRSYAVMAKWNGAAQKEVYGDTKQP